MRWLGVGLFVFVLTAPASAQELASANLTAYLTIPPVLRLQVNESDGARTTLLVTANRDWVLSVSRSCQSPCAKLQARVENASAQQTETVELPAGATPILRGHAGTRMPVVVELIWDGGRSPPDAARLQYMVTAS